MADDMYAALNIPGKRVHIRDASLSRRLLAFLADLLILDFTVFSAFQSIFATGVDWSTLFQGSFAFSSAMYAATVAMALLSLGYFVVFEYLLGKTPGMSLLNIEVENITLARAFVRNLLFIPLFPFTVLLVTEPVYLIFRKTRLLEVLSGTRTVEHIYY
jgi:hypothetical protein